MKLASLFENTHVTLTDEDKLKQYQDLYDKYQHKVDANEAHEGAITTKVEKWEELGYVAWRSALTEPEIRGAIKIPGLFDNEENNYYGMVIMPKAPPELHSVIARTLLSYDAVAKRVDYFTHEKIKVKDQIEKQEKRLAMIQQKMQKKNAKKSQISQSNVPAKIEFKEFNSWGDGKTQKQSFTNAYFKSKDNRYAGSISTYGGFTPTQIVDVNKLQQILKNNNVSPLTIVYASKDNDSKRPKFVALNDNSSVIFKSYDPTVFHGQMVYLSKVSNKEFYSNTLQSILTADRTTQAEIFSKLSKKTKGK